MTTGTGSSEMFRLDGEVALVTGASSGLGHHFAGVLAKSGARVVLAARRTDRLESLAGRIEAEGGHALAVPLDVRDPASVRAAFDQAEAAFGTVTVLVNNAGVTDPAFLTRMTEQQWRGVLDVNLDGVFRVGQEAARRMVTAGRGGSIVNIASIVGLGAIKTLSAYAASKAAVLALTRNWALELARDKVRVNAIAPGYIATELNDEFWETDAGKRMIAHVPMRRLGRLQELDGPLLLLASRAGSFMTGSTLVVDGGHLLPTE
ncbi:MAG: glucose 1-dehydrogenase [Hyphomicrobiaceae bacterium]|nr:glucose 1-dehydrogenase [Hyphomicrobiaceae bacterium]